MDLQSEGIFLNQVEALDITIEQDKFPELATALARSFEAMLGPVGLDRSRAVEAILDTALRVSNPRARQRWEGLRDRVVDNDPAAVPDLLGLLTHDYDYSTDANSPGEFRLPIDVAPELGRFCVGMALEAANNTINRTDSKQQLELERESLVKMVEERPRIKALGQLKIILKGARPGSPHRRVLDFDIENAAMDIESFRDEYDDYKARLQKLLPIMPKESCDSLATVLLPDDPLDLRPVGAGRSQPL